MVDVTHLWVTFRKFIFGPLFSHLPKMDQLLAQPNLCCSTIHLKYSWLRLVGGLGLISSEDPGLSKDERFYSDTEFRENKRISWRFVVTSWKFCSQLLFHTCGSPLSPSPPLIFALIPIIRCFCLAWHPTAGFLLDRVRQLYTHTFSFYPECSFSLSSTQSCRTGANRTY